MIRPLQVSQDLPVRRRFPLEMVSLCPVIVGPLLRLAEARSGRVPLPVLPPTAEEPSIEPSRTLMWLGCGTVCSRGANRAADSVRRCQPKFRLSLPEIVSGY